MKNNNTAPLVQRVMEHFSPNEPTLLERFKSKNNEGIIIEKGFSGDILEIPCEPIGSVSKIPSLPKGFSHIPPTAVRQHATINQPQPRSWCGYLSSCFKKAPNISR